jgi:hypothetical protein
MLTNINKDVIILIPKTNNKTWIGNKRPFTFLACVYVTLVNILHDLLLFIMKFNCRREEYPW